MKKAIPLFISRIGHPLVTIPVFVIIVMFTYENFENAVFVSSLIIGCIFLPLTLWLYLKYKNGSHTNFDVSDQKQRKSLFPFILPLLMIVTIVLYKTGQSKQVCLAVFFGLVITFVSQLVNFYVKSSLHVSLTIYLSFLIMPLNDVAGILLLVFAVLIGWSRVLLGRHSLKEVVYGGGVGLVVSLVMFFTIRSL
jgi:membrane-associated phospholipid phosphatase